ncbi:MFS transporter [Mycobacterium intracellulare]|uniref:MFS transporter n=4 Tax=Mycobacterium intracellulare TaxID=1767 RepID=A0ABT7NWX5_MYCIT|nr:MFS transporter [Mycobacterium intracellulare]MCF1811700.1 MFS transporter [Mycobacterium intracellulare subsp. intracellulare]MCV7326069.1 MFS transporter [Mycobacterium intracellulare subsp. chimaera]MDM3905612.1 MFS transporter [Mycobacterium intracellulare subsp. chimaera]MDM3925529.1 MFS transporter [Mycobacterium intracellulare subsp. chimaera]MDM3932864.1 MFS transporter [Mycobacterium intracellulare subsp. chimaera]
MQTTPTRRWVMLGTGLIATLSATVFINGIAFLIPALNDVRGINLAEAALLSAMPSFGMVVTLIAWGYILDIVGERIVLTAGLALTAAAALIAAAVPESMLTEGIALFGGGMAAASANTASGRLVTGWFPPQQRGLAMGIRQTAQPLGIALAALVLPELGERNISVALLFPAAVCAVSAVLCAVWVRDPARPERSTADKAELASPYRGTTVLWRIHFASALLMVPQTVVLTFMLVWLMKNQHWSIATAGVLVSFSQLLSALGRIAVGRWSDRLGSRMRPIRIIAMAAAVVMVLLAIADHAHSAMAVTLMVAASVITVLDNGLAFTAISEVAGRFWSGRAMGAQNTTQRLTAAVGPPLFGEMIDATGYPLAFAVCALFPLLALPVVPSEARSRAAARG